MSRLQQAMFANALFSSFSALCFWIFGEQIAIGSDIPILLLRVIAVGLLGFALLLVYGVFGQQRHSIGRLAVLLDWLWVLGSVFAVFLPVSNLGRVGIVGIAVLVAGFALRQQHSLRQGDD